MAASRWTIVDALFVTNSVAAARTRRERNERSEPRYGAGMLSHSPGLEDFCVWNCRAAGLGSGLR